MNEHNDQEADQQASANAQGPHHQDMLELHMTRALQERASRVNFSPELRQNILQRLPERRAADRRARFVPAFALAAALLLVLATATYTLFALNVHHGVPVAASIQYVMDKTYETPTQLAHNGQLISIDPTGQHLVYEAGNQPGVMYTADLRDPVKTNTLAMEFAREASWSPNGSALVITIYPQGLTEPLLALVPTGKYMFLLGHAALASSWSPTTPQEISFVKQENGSTQLWEISPTGQHAQPIATMPIISDTVQHMRWSPDGRLLALLTTNAQKPQAFNGPSHAIYIMNAQTQHTYELIQPGNFTINTLFWSPNGHILTYVSTDTVSGQTTLHALDVTKNHALFSASLQHSFQGASWSPDNRVLLYSDGGTLRTRVLSGPQIQLPKQQSLNIDPIWLDSHHILYLETTNGVSQLAQLRMI